MCDFLDFGLTFFSIMCIKVVARLPQRLKSTFFEKNFFTPLAPSEPLCSKKFLKTLILAFQKTLILAFEVIVNTHNGEKSETKIKQITHSVPGSLYYTVIGLEKKSCNAEKEMN